MADILGLPPAGLRPLGPRAATAVAICALLGLAATQPVAADDEDQRVRRIVAGALRRRRLPFDARIRRTRRDRHDSSAPEASCDIFAGAVPDVPAGVAGLTDRILPYVFATSDEATFEDVVGPSVLVEAAAAAGGRDERDELRRACRRSRRYGLLPRALRRADLRPRDRRGDRAVLDGGRAQALDGARLLAPRRPGLGTRRARLQRRRRARERIPAGRGRTASVRRLAAVTRGQSFDAGQTARAAAALRRHAEVGPAARASASRRQRPLAPLLAGGRTRRLQSGSRPRGIGAPLAQARVAYAGAMTASTVNGSWSGIARRARCSAVLPLASVAGGAPGELADGGRRLGRLRPHRRQRPSLAADGDHARQRRRSSTATTSSTSRSSTRTCAAVSSRIRSRSAARSS